MSETKEKIEVKEYSNSCCCDCCHCKKIFMLIVILLLSFIAGIMVGNSHSHYIPNSYYYTMQPQKHHNKIKKHKMHRGMHQVPSAPTPTQPNIPLQTSQDPLNQEPYLDSPIGGFIIEVD